MKKFVSFFAATALVATMMTTSSCTKTCEAGYEGSDCKTEVRAKYYGNWNEAGTAMVGSNSIPVTGIVAVRSTSSSAVTDIISTFTFNGSTYSIKATLGSDGKTFTIASQSGPDGTTITGGTGSFPTTTTVTETFHQSYPAAGTNPAYTADISLTGTKQ